MMPIEVFSDKNWPVDGSSADLLLKQIEFCQDHTMIGHDGGCAKPTRAGVS
jgi:hypothetical protein